jgi:nucleotide-binding universal stress UspA family protein
MTLNGWLQIGFFLVAVLAVTPPLGRFMTIVFSRKRTWLDPALRPIERLIYRLTRVDESHEMRWTEYAAAMLLFSAVSMLVLYVMQRAQPWLPWNPQRLRQGKIYKPEKVEQALANFFRKGNLSTLRELALRAVADEVGEKAASYRAREGLEPALIPERVMVCMSSNALAPRVLRRGARIAGRPGAKWYAVYVETPEERPPRIPPEDSRALTQNIRLAETLGATVVRVKAGRTAEGLIAFAQREGITHVIFGQSARSRWEVLWRGSTLNNFLGSVRDAAVQVVPLDDAAPAAAMKAGRHD